MNQRRHIRLKSRCVYVSLLAVALFVLPARAQTMRPDTTVLMPQRRAAIIKSLRKQDPRWKNVREETIVMASIGSGIVKVSATQEYQQDSATGPAACYAGADGRLLDNPAAVLTRMRHVPSAETEVLEIAIMLATEADPLGRVVKTPRDFQHIPHEVLNRHAVRVPSVARSGEKGWKAEVFSYQPGSRAGPPLPQRSETVTRHLLEIKGARYRLTSQRSVVRVADAR